MTSNLEFYTDNQGKEENMQGLKNVTTNLPFLRKSPDNLFHLSKGKTKKEEEVAYRRQSSNTGRTQKEFPC